MYYLAFDTETGGIVQGVSLLTAYYGILDDRFNIISELDLKLIPDDGIYHVTPKAMEINKIDLGLLGNGAFSYKQAGTALYNFLSDGPLVGPDKYIPVGHNLTLDIRMTKEFLISEGSYNTFISYRTLDTCSIAQFLRVSGILPQDLSCSGEDLAKYFGVENKVTGSLHNARYDALTTAYILQELMKLVKK